MGEKSQVEAPVLRWCKQHRIMQVKMNTLGRAHWPDRMFNIPGGRPVYIEFKAPGEVPTEMQEQILLDLIQLGYYAYVADNAKGAIDILEAHILESASLPKSRSKVFARALQSGPIPGPWSRENLNRARSRAAAKRERAATGTGAGSGSVASVLRRLAARD